jgi:large subunit ribosomal protein L2
MGVRIRVQRRGRGSSTFKATTHKRVAPSLYPSLKHTEKELKKATIEKLVHDPGRGAPLLKVRAKDEVFHIVAPEGVSIGQEVQYGETASTSIGNILPLGHISTGTLVCNLEGRPGDGGKIAKSSGTYATVVAHTPEGTLVRLPSKKSIYLDSRCRATIGVVSGAGRADKPFFKAGKRHHWLTSKGKIFPRSKGVAMVPAAHPHGGGAHKSSSLKPTTVSKTAPPGQKVGLIAARQSGRKKRRR